MAGERQGSVGDVRKAAIPSATQRRSRELSLKYLEKCFGSGAVMNLQDSAASHPSIPTGHPFIDYVTGIGGLPRGKIVELFGRESSGKSTLVLQTIANEQRLGGCALYLDLENSFDSHYAMKLGVDLSKEKLLVAQPFCAEEAFEIAREMIDNQHVTVVVVDSAAALVPRAELDSDAIMGKADIGSQSRVIGQAIKQLAGRCNKTGICLIFINQIRSVISRSGRGPTETTPGGNALKFYASMRMELVKIGSVKGKLLNTLNNTTYDGITGIRVRVKVAKNKCGAPFKQSEIILKMGEGFAVDTSILELAVAQGVLLKGPTGWYDLSAFDLKNLRGDQAMNDYLENNPEFKKMILSKVSIDSAKDSSPKVLSMETNIGENTENSFGDSEEVNAVLSGETPVVQSEAIIESSDSDQGDNWEGEDDDIPASE